LAEARRRGESLDSFPSGAKEGKGGLLAAKRNGAGRKKKPHTKKGGTRSRISIEKHKVRPTFKKGEDFCEGTGKNEKGEGCSRGPVHDKKGKKRGIFVSGRCEERKEKKQIRSKTSQVKRSKEGRGLIFPPKQKRRGRARSKGEKKKKESFRSR